MTIYQLTANPDVVIRLDDDESTTVPRDNWQWDAYATWLAEGNAPEPVPEPTAQEIASANQARRNELLANATAAMGPLQDAVDLDVATPEEASMLTLWKQFRVAVNRVDLAISPAAWPAPPSASNYSTASHGLAPTA